MANQPKMKRMKASMVLMATLFLAFPAQANDVPGHHHIAPPYRVGTHSYNGSCWPGPPLLPCSAESGDAGGRSSAVAVIDSGARGQVPEYLPSTYGSALANEFVEHTVAETATTARVVFTLTHTFAGELFPNPNPVSASAQVVIHVYGTCGEFSCSSETAYLNVSGSGTKTFDATLGSVDRPLRGKVTVLIWAIADVAMTPTVEQRQTVTTPGSPVRVCHPLGREEICIEGPGEFTATVYRSRGYARSSMEVTVPGIDIFES